MAIEAAPNLPAMRRANKAELAEWFEISLPTVESWVRKGCPVVQRGSRGVPWVFDLRDVAEWRFSRDVGDAQPEEEIPRHPYDRLNYFKAQREQLAVEKELGLLVTVDEARYEQSVLTKAVTSVLDTMPDRLERELGLDAATLEAIERAIDELRREMYEEAIGASHGERGTDTA